MLENDVDDRISEIERLKEIQKNKVTSVEPESGEKLEASTEAPSETLDEQKSAESEDKTEETEEEESKTETTEEENSKTESSEPPVEETDEFDDDDFGDFEEASASIESFKEPDDPFPETPTKAADFGFAKFAESPRLTPQTSFEGPVSF